MAPDEKSPAAFNTPPSISELAEELENSRKELELFASAASHDLQAPLLTVSGYLDLLKKQYQGKLSPEADEFIGFALDGVRQMRALLNDLLTYSRTISRPAAFKEGDLNSLFGVAVQGQSKNIKEAGAILKKDSLPPAFCDSVQMTILFENLISNAIKFKGKEKLLIRVTCTRDKDNWVFCMKDNGIGFEPKYTKEIFLPFRRLNNQTEYPGSGLGLALCKKIIERHHGKIWAESMPGQGSSFFFALPANQ